MDIPLKTLLNEDCEIQELGRNIKVYKKPKGPTKKLPKTIKLNEDLAWALGFYMAEGNKTSYGIGASNSEIFLLRKLRKTLNNIFNLTTEQWFVYIQSNKKHNNSYLEEIRRIFETKKVRTTSSRLATQDNFEIRLNNTLIALLMKNLINKSRKLIPKNKKIMKSFLRGYEVGDGSVLRRKECLYGISITTKNEENKELLSKCFEKLYADINLRVRWQKNKEVFQITLAGVNLMTELILDKHFKTSKRQWKKLVNAYKKKQYTRSHLRYWRVIRDNPLTVNEIAEKTKRSHWAVRDAIKKDRLFSLINFVGKKPNSLGPPSHLYQLTKKGRRLLEYIEEIEG